MLGVAIGVAAGLLTVSLCHYAAPNSRQREVLYSYGYTHWASLE